jgi:peptide/nickel transport system substrate-binding protein
MLSGFRWQLVALLVAAVLFAASLSTRLEMDSIPTATLQPSPEATQAIIPIPTPSPSVVIAPQIPAAGVVTFREGVVGAVSRLNPLYASLNSVDKDVSSLIFEGLTRINAYGEPEPALALNWITSSDGLEYVVRLREDVLWQDGTPFTAADVVFTMSLLRAPDFSGQAALGAFWRTIETEQLGDHLVRFRLTQPLGSFPDKLRIGLLPYHALQGTTAAQLPTHPFNLSPIGTGPYQLEALRTDGGIIREIDLRVAPVYRQRPEGQSGYAIDRMRFRLYSAFDVASQALRGGEIDGLVASSRIQRAPLLGIGDEVNLNVHTAIESSLGILIFNWQKDSTRFFREQRVRLALETGVNRSSVIERWLLNSAVQADSPLFPGSWAYIAELPWAPYDPITAQTLLDTANLRTANTDSDSTEEPSPYLLTFSVLTPKDPALESMVREIATQWSQLNLNVIVDAQETEIYQTRLEAGDFDAALVELALGDSADPDVYAFWHQGQYPDGDNYGGVDDRRISEALERGRQEPSGINRDIYYEKFQKDFVDRAIALPLYYPLFTYVTAAGVDGVQLGFIGSPSDRFQTIKNWSIRQG